MSDTEDTDPAPVLWSSKYYAAAGYLSYGKDKSRLLSHCLSSACVLFFPSNPITDSEDHFPII